jgi:hypothetical protein
MSTYTPDGMKPVPIVSARQLVALVVIVVVAMTPALWPITGFGAWLTSLVLRFGVAFVGLFFIVRFFRRSGFRRAA